MMGGSFGSFWHVDCAPNPRAMDNSSVSDEVEGEWTKIITAATSKIDIDHVRASLQAHIARGFARTCWTTSPRARRSASSSLLSGAVGQARSTKRLAGPTDLVGC